MVMPAQPEQPKFTAVQSILLAAEDLTKAGHTEFSEFDLTVAAWTRDKTKFGLRGYGDKFPDHKRVMMEIMGQKPNSPVYRKLLEKIRPNTYRLTPLGKDAARRLRTGADALPKATTTTTTTTAAARPSPAKHNSPTRDLYDTVSHYTSRQEFRRWKDDPSEPRDWATAAAFLGIQKGIDLDPAERLEDIRASIKSAMEWCRQSETDNLTSAGAGGQAVMPIHVRELSEMDDFLQALIYRFPNHLDRKPSKGDGPKGGKKRFDD